MDAERIPGKQLFEETTLQDNLLLSLIQPLLVDA
jgi:hypothetical protein